MTTEMTGDNGNQGGGDDWRSSLGDDFKDHSALKPFKGLNDLAKGYVELSSKIGANTVVVPSEGAGEHDWEKFHMKALGRPEKIDGYDFIPKTPEGVTIADEKVASLKEKAFKLGLSKKAAEQFVNDALGISGEVVKSYQDTTKGEAERKQREGLEKLKTEMGAKYENFKHDARIALKHFGGQELLDYLDETGLGNNAALIKAFGKVAGAMGDGGFEKGEGAFGGRTKGDAEREYNSILSDPKHPYNSNDNTIAHQDAVKHVESLLKYIHS